MHIASTTFKICRIRIIYDSTIDRILNRIEKQSMFLYYTYLFPSEIDGGSLPNYKSDSASKLHDLLNVIHQNYFLVITRNCKDNEY